MALNYELSVNLPPEQTRARIEKAIGIGKGYLGKVKGNAFELKRIRLTPWAYAPYYLKGNIFSAQNGSTIQGKIYYRFTVLDYVWAILSIVLLTVLLYDFLIKGSPPQLLLIPTGMILIHTVITLVGVFFGIWEKKGYLRFLEREFKDALM